MDAISISSIRTKQLAQDYGDWPNGAAVESLSQQKQEPIWFTDLRHRAWRFFEEIPWPTGKEEEWRRTRLTGLEHRRLPAGSRH